jgi:endo-1,4-beta-D-glucanase Y
MRSRHSRPYGFVVAGVMVVSAACTSSAQPTPSPPASSAQTTRTPALIALATRFLNTYVNGDGRVLRRDQGGDIVSEGQAYGMLIAEMAARPAIAERIWTWTRRHLLRSDGLLAFHATATGRVLDPASATDADTLTAFALLRYQGPRAAGLHADGQRLAMAVLARETVKDASGRLVPVAGSWAHGPAAAVDPSYWMPGVFDELTRLTGNAQWSDISATTVDLVDRSTQGGTSLPPDWGVLSGSDLMPTPAPDGSASVQYGLDAQRVPIWFATSCSTRARAIAASWWRTLNGNGASSALALTLRGSVLNGQTNPVPLLAAAAAARAAGDVSAASALTANALAQARTTPTYYGDAWLVLASGLWAGSLTRCNGSDPNPSSPSRSSSGTPTLRSS